MRHCSFLFLFLFTLSVHAQPTQQRQTSFLETYDLKTGKSTVLAEYPYNVQAPNWSPDGKWLVVNSRGKMYKIDAEKGGEPILIPTGSCNSCNNDHVISFDGKWLVISNSGEGGSKIYAVPFPEGSDNPRLITPRGPSWLHGVSPDNKTIAYTAPSEPGVALPFGYEIFTCPFEGGSEKNISNAPDHDDGSEYSKDGKHLWWSSLRDGTMQVWRFDADGGNPKQMTNDTTRVNCFPHISPDGQHVYWLAYNAKEVAVNAHPANYDVEIMSMKSDGSEQKPILQFFGGQGTCNVNGWNPDSTKFAYVRYSRVETGERPAPGKHLGQFSHSVDVGDIKDLVGSVQYDAAAQTYTVKGSGANMWGAKDAFQFVYVPIDGNFEMSAFQTLLNEGTDAHRKAGIIFRETLDEDSPGAFVTVHGDGLTSFQYRMEKAGPTVTDNYEPKDPTPKYISLARKGDLFIVKIGKDKVDPSTAKEHEFKFAKKGYLGIYVCSHSNNDYERAIFKDVKFYRR